MGDAVALWRFRRMVAGTPVGMYYEPGRTTQAVYPLRAHACPWKVRIEPECIAVTLIGCRGRVSTPIERVSRGLRVRVRLAGLLHISVMGLAL